jgi:hypothetical protein
MRGEGRRPVGEVGRVAQGAGSAETLANLVAHLFAELFATRRPFVFGNIMAVEDVEVFQDRVTIARHRQDPQQFARRPAGAADFPSAYRVGALAGGEPTEPCHFSRRQAFADGDAKILAKLFQFGAGHWDRSIAWAFGIALWEHWGHWAELGCQCLYCLKNVAFIVMNSL